MTERSEERQATEERTSISWPTEHGSGEFDVISKERALEIVRENLPEFALRCIRLANENFDGTVDLDLQTGEMRADSDWASGSSTWSVMYKPVVEVARFGLDLAENADSEDLLEALGEYEGFSLAFEEERDEYRRYLDEKAVERGYDRCESLSELREHYDDGYLISEIGREKGQCAYIAQQVIDDSLSIFGSLYNWPEDTEQTMERIVGSVYMEDT